MQAIWSPMSGSCGNHAPFAHRGSVIFTHHCTHGWLAALYAHKLITIDPGTFWNKQCSAKLYSSFNHKFRARCLCHSVVFSVLRELWTLPLPLKQLKAATTLLGWGAPHSSQQNCCFYWVHAWLACQKMLSPTRESILYITTRSAAYRAWPRSLCRRHFCQEGFVNSLTPSNNVVLHTISMSRCYGYYWL